MLENKCKNCWWWVAEECKRTQARQTDEDYSCGMHEPLFAERGWAIRNIMLTPVTPQGSVMPVATESRSMEKCG